MTTAAAGGDLEVLRIHAAAPLAAALRGLGALCLALPDGRLVPVEARPPTTPPPRPAELRPTHDAVVPLAGASRRLRAWAGDLPGERFRVAVDGPGDFSVAFAVDAAGSTVRQLSAATGAAPGVLLEVVLGPPLILALALRSRFVLHASASRRPDGAAVLFLGDSGAGKSTLAAFLDAPASPGWRRLSDDLTPVNAGPQGVVVEPRFPQLSLASPAEASAPAPGSPTPLAAAYELAAEPESAADGASPRVEIQPLSPRRAAEALLAQTVASRLFDAPLLAAGLGWAAQVAAAGVHRLLYPRRRDALPAVRAALEGAGAAHG